MATYLSYSRLFLAFNPARFVVLWKELLNKMKDRGQVTLFNVDERLRLHFQFEFDG